MSHIKTKCTFIQNEKITIIFRIIFTKYHIHFFRISYSQSITNVYRGHCAFSFRDNISSAIISRETAANDIAPLKDCGMITMKGVTIYCRVTYPLLSIRQRYRMLYGAIKSVKSYSK